MRPVDLNEHVKEIGEDVSAAHAGVDAANLLGAERGCLCTQCSELFCNLLGLLRLLHIVAPSRTQIFVWMPRKPEPPETVLNHVAHDPVGGEELRRSGQGVLRHLDILLEVREHRILRLAVVVLIEPADDLHLILPVLRRDACDKLMDNTAIAQEVLGKEQLGIIADALKHTRKDSVQCVALSDDEILEQPLIIVRVLERIDLLRINPLHRKIKRLRHDLWAERIVFIGKDAHAGREIAVYLHEAQCDKAVEPCVGDALDGGSIALCTDTFNEGAALSLLRGREHAPHHDLRTRIARILRRDAIEGSTLRDTPDECPPCPYGIFFDRVLVHAVLLHRSSCAVQSAPSTASAVPLPRSDGGGLCA